MSALTLSPRETLTQIFEAKLQKPNLGVVLRRDRLFKLLDDADCALVAINADAGYGKTVLVASYLQERKRSSIWYHIGGTDRLPAAFVKHIAHALASMSGETSAGNPPALDDATDPELAGAVLSSVLNQLDPPVDLVLEDYNRAQVDSPIHRVVLAMVEHLLPGRRIFLLARSRPNVPMARLTISGKARMIAKDELAFTPEETAAFFELSHQHHLSDEELALVARRLEGWVAGLRLTLEALKLTRASDRERFWASYSESPVLFEYLAEEVLVALPADTLSFLQKTSIFAVLHPELIDEYLPGCNAMGTLQRLAKENLFTTSLGFGRQFRYHALFRQYLHQQLLENSGEDGVRALHTKAADLYARREEVGYAIGHSLVAGDFQRAVRFLEQLADHHRSDVLLDLMEGWLERAFPGIEGVCGVALRRLLPISVYEAVLPGLRHLAEAPRHSVDLMAQAHAQQRLGIYHYYRGNLDECLVWLQCSRDTFRSAGHPISASISGTLVAFAYLFKGMPELAEAPLEEALGWAGNEGAFAIMNALFAKAELALARGAFAEAEEAARASLQGKVSVPVGRSFSLGTLALALLYQGRRAEAEAAAVEAVSLAEACAIRTELGFTQTRLAAVFRAVGRLDEARAAAEKAVSITTGFDFLLARAMLVQAEIAATSGQSGSGELWARTREFWSAHGYRIHKTYDGLVAPTLVARMTEESQSTIVPLAGASVDHESALPTSGDALDQTPAGGQLVIKTLGTFRLIGGGHEATPGTWSRSSARRLFCYLLLHRNRAVARDELLEAFWPEDDPQQSSNRLWVAVHALRRELTPFSDIVRREGQGYCLRLPESADLDIDRYTLLIADGMARGDREALRQAAALYHGDFLLEYQYDELLQGERSRLRALQMEVLMRLGEMAENDNDLSGAADYYRRAHEMDSCAAKPALRAMAVLVAREEFGAALVVYDQHRAALEKDIGLKPGREIQALRRRILDQQRV